MKNLILITTFFITLCFVFNAEAQTKTKTTQTKSKKTMQNLQGKLLQKPWSKSTQSYCAQGSEYFVLDDGNEEFVLDNKTGKDWMDFEGKQVMISGYKEKKTIKPSNNLNEQRPVELDINGNTVEAAFTCEIFVVKKIKAI